MSNPAETKHPKGLYYLFLSEMWERFGFYLMLGIFFLYMTDSTTTGGMGLSRKDASDLFGTYIALVYLTPFIGGLLADKILGYRLAITIGGILMGLGYLGLAIPGDTSFYVSLLLIIIGNGFFKPNISTLLGSLYSEEKYQLKKDSGYNIFYMGINLGAFVCNFVAAYLRNKYGWGYAFAAAGIGMFIGLIWFWAGNKHYKNLDVLKPTQAEDMSIAKVFGLVLLPALIAGILGWYIPGNYFGSDSTDAFLFACLPVVLFYISLWIRASKEDKNPIAALLSIYAVVIIFWAIMKQNGTALTIWAEKFTNRTLTENIQTIVPAGMVQNVDNILTEVPKRDSLGAEIKDINGKNIMELSPHPYLRNLPKEQFPKDGEKMKLISTEIFQSINPFFVVLFTPLLVGFFNFLRKRGKEPSTPAKIGLGLLITALSTLVMVGAAIATNNGAIKGSAMWLISAYGVITIGELCLSPMGLSLVSKLSPPRLTALMMGGWFLATSIGNKLSGIIASLWDSIDNKSHFFLINFIGAMLAATATFAMLKWLRKIIFEHTGKH